MMVAGGDHEASGSDARPEMPRHGPTPPGKKKTLAEDLDVPPETPNSWRGRKHVVIVMDALKEFSIKPLKWALEHVVEPGCLVTLLGVMPWLSFPLSCKTWLDVWHSEIEDLSTMKECPEWRHDVRRQKLRVVVELCEARGVVPLKKVAMGHPVRLVVLEQTTNLHATWVVFDRHHRKRSTFYRKRIPCNMVIMSGNGQVDMLKVRPMLERGETLTPGASPALVAAPSPKLIISEAWMEMFNKEREKKANEGSNMLTEFSCSTQNSAIIQRI